MPTGDLAIPPVIEILLREDLELLASRDNLSQTDFARELQAQAEWTLDSFDYQQSNQDGFLSSPAGSLNPLSGIGKGIRRSAIEASVDEFLRLVAIYSDTVIIPDTVTPLIAQFSDHLFHEYCGHASQFVYAVVGLKRLEEFIRSGAIRFSKVPAPGNEEIQRGISAIADRLLDDDIADLRVKCLRGREKPRIIFQIPVLLTVAETDSFYGFVPTDSEFEELERLLGTDQWVRGPTHPVLLRYIQSVISNVVTSVLHEAFVAEQSGSLLIGASRVEARVMATLRGILPASLASDDWTSHRSIELPWIRSLNPSQLLVLKNEAQYALPKLRDLILKATTTENVSEAARVGILSELRAQAAEVEAEMAAIAKQSFSTYRWSLQSTSVAFVLFGLATGAPTVMATSLAAFLATQAHLRTVGRDASKDDVRLISSPAFALVKAKQLLATA